MNKDMFQIARSWMALVVTALAMTACEYKELIDGQEPDNRVPVDISFDWQNVDSIPSRMQVMFYRSNESGYQRCDVGNGTSRIYITPGEYNITAWNNDGSHVYFNGYSRQEEINATTPVFNPQSGLGILQLLDSLYPGQKVLDYPDYMVHGNLLGVKVENSNPQKIVVTPDSMVVTVDVNIGGIAGLEMVRQVKGVIGNVAGRRYMAYENRITDPSTVIFAARSNAADSTVTAHFWVFGLEPEELEGSEHKATLFFWTTGGNVFIEIDISDLIRKVGKDANILSIDIPDLDIDLRDYIHNGWDLNIDDWDNVITPIGF